MPECEDTVSTREIEIRFSRVIPNLRAARTHFDGRTGEFHDARKRRVDEVAVVFEDFAREFFVRIASVQRVDRFAPFSLAIHRRAERDRYAAVRAVARSCSAVASITSMASCAPSMRMIRSRRLAAPG